MFIFFGLIWSLTNTQPVSPTRVTDPPIQFWNIDWFSIEMLWMLWFWLVFLIKIDLLKQVGGNLQDITCPSWSPSVKQSTVNTVKSYVSKLTKLTMWGGRLLRFWQRPLFSLKKLLNKARKCLISKLHIVTRVHPDHFYTLFFVYTVVHNQSVDWTCCTGSQGSQFPPTQTV